MHKRFMLGHSLKINFFLLFFLLCIFPSINFASTVRVIIGSYLPDVMKENVPLIVVGDINSSKWSIIKNFNNLPKQAESAGLSAVNCTEDFCVAAGSYSDPYPVPFLLVSYDKAQTWSYVGNISGLPSDMDSFSITSAKSIGSTTILTGSIHSRNFPDPSTKNSPLLLVSHDKGQSWTQINTISGLPEIENGWTSSVSCFGESCVATGYYKKLETHQESLLLLVSHDRGISWTFVPFDENLYFFTPVHCVGKQCVLAGKTVDQNSQHKPVFLVSNDEGDTWAKIDSTNFPTTYDFELKSLSCTENSCVIVGSYNKTYDGPSSPLILVSDKDRKVWTWVKNIRGITKRDNDLTLVSCENNYCVASGTCTDADSNHYLRPTLPLLLTSHDNGQSWSSVTNIPGYLPYPSVDLNSLECLNNTCLAAGSFEPLPPFVGKNPLLFVSKDQGRTWGFVKKFDGVQMPWYFKFGWFTDVA